MKKKILYALLIIVICFTLVGCGSSENDENNNETNNTSEKGNKKESKEETGKKDNDEKETDYEIKDEDGKVIINLGGTTTQVYYHDGEKITDFEIYLDWGDNKTAKEMVEYAKKAADETIDFIEVRGKYVVYNYAEGNYNDMTTYEELSEYAKLFDVILDANNKKNDADETSWPTAEYKRPENCILVSLEPDVNGLKLLVKWNSMDDAKEYKKYIKSEHDDFGTVEETDDYYAFQGTKVRISYSKNDEKENYILFYEQ